MPFLAADLRFASVVLAAAVLAAAGRQSSNAPLTFAFTEIASKAGLDAYSGRALARVWKAVRFSWWMTLLLHRFPDAEPFAEKLRAAELGHVTTSRHAAASLAENYVGLPY